MLKKFLSYIEMKPLVLQLLPPCLLHVAPSEEGASGLTVAAPQIMKYRDRAPLGLLQRKKT